MARSQYRIPAIATRACFHLSRMTLIAKRKTSRFADQALTSANLPNRHETVKQVCVNIRISLVN